MHSKQQIEQFLAELGTHPHHKWGQNFLIDLNLMQMVPDCIEIGKNDLVLEVGHGTGSLTTLLAERAGQVVAVDIDPDMHTIASRELAELGNVSFIHTDILKKKSRIDEGVMALVREKKAECSGRFLLVANLPYNVASPLIINLITENPALDGMSVTVQEEVADRMAAGPERSSDYGKLSVILGATGEVEKVRVLKPNAFWPAPKINSAIVSWQRNKDLSLEDIESLKQTCDLLFGKRRKQIKSCLPKGEQKARLVEQIQNAGIETELRAEKLTIDQFLIISQILAK